MASVLLLADRVLDENMEEAPGVLVEDGRIIAVTGSPRGYATVRRVRGTLTPGLVDAHLHITGLGLSLAGADLHGSKSPEEVARRLSAAPGPVAYGRGWDEEAFNEPGRLPDRRLLDTYIPGRPAIAVRVCGHLATANTRLLAETGVHELYPGLVDSERGVLLEDAVGEAVRLALRSAPIRSLVRMAVEHIAGSGVAGVSSMQCPPSEARALAELESRGGLPIRVSCYPEPRDVQAVRRALERARLAGLVGVKLFSDGSLGARTAYLSGPYHDDPGSRGRLLMDSRAIERVAGQALSRGLRVATHAIGDAALLEVFEAYERLGGGERLRIEHASLVPPGVERRIAGLGVHVVVQPRFRVSDWWIEKRLGPGRARWAYRFRSLARSGARLALSTDAPVEPVEPWETFRAALGLCRAPACVRGESLSLREALYAYTRGAAAASGGPVALLGVLRRGAPAVFTLWRDECCMSSSLLITL